MATRRACCTLIGDMPARRRLRHAFKVGRQSRLLLLLGLIAIMTLSVRAMAEDAVGAHSMSEAMVDVSDGEGHCYLLSACEMTHLNAPNFDRAPALTQAVSPKSYVLSSIDTNLGPLQSHSGSLEPPPPRLSSL